MSYSLYKSVFDVGATVRVIKQHNYPGEQLVGLIGTVRSASGSSIAVNFDTVKNNRSSYDSFYFKPNELILVDAHNNENMEEKNMEKITGYLNCVKVQFDGADKASVYHYANFDGGLAVGDTCIVTYGAGKIAVAKVVEFVEKPDSEVVLEVVTRVFMDDYEARVKAREKAAELKAKMEARAKQLQDIALYQMLAKDDPDMAALLEEYQTLPRV